MDRFAAMLLLLTVLVTLVFMLMALFALAPVTVSCLLSLLYSLYLFMAYEESSIHRAQEFENRFWTIFGLLLSTALFFANDSPLAFGKHWSPTLGFTCVLFSGYVMHIWDRSHHRKAISQQTILKRGSLACTSLSTLHGLGIKVEDQLARINENLQSIDQLLIPSTINNFINERFVLNKEREIIAIFEDCDARALNYLINHVKLALLFYKIKDHRRFGGNHRTAIIQLLAVDRLPILTVTSRVIVLYSLQLLKLKANPQAEFFVKNIIVNTKQDDLSQLKSLMDNKGDYFSMTKLVYNDLTSETIRQEILAHIKHEAAIQQAHMQMGTQRSKKRCHWAWRKVLSDVDDTLVCSGGSYPAGVDKKYGKKVVYPGVMAFYRELDLGTEGPDEWTESRLGNLVFLSARPHLYKDMSEKANFAKFEKLRHSGEDGRMGMHTVPSILSGDIQSGRKYIVSNDFEHLALKKFDNFQRYVTIYPEYKHVFVADNGQGDVRAGDLMYTNFPYEFEAMYVHLVQDRAKTHGYNPEEFRKNEFNPFFFNTYPEAALHAATIAYPPLISLRGMRRVCVDATKDFQAIPEQKWATAKTKAERRMELNQAIWRANTILEAEGLEPVPLIEAEQIWNVGDKVRTPYGIGLVLSFSSTDNLYEVSLDWRPLNVQLADHLTKERNETIIPRISTATAANQDNSNKVTLETVVEIEEIDDDAYLVGQRRPEKSRGGDIIVTPSNGGEPADNDQLNQVLGDLPHGSQSNGVGGGGSYSTSQDRDKEAANDKQTQIITTKAKAKNYDTCKAKAWVAGHNISPYTPPILPKLDKTRGSIFTFWSPGGHGSHPKKSHFKNGAHCSTPFGNATVVEHRLDHQIVVVAMEGWTARAYLREEDVKIASKGLIRTLFRKMSGAESAQPQAKPRDFPYASGTVISTPYGKGEVTKPLPSEKTVTVNSTPVTDKISNKSSSDTSEVAGGRPLSGSLGSKPSTAQELPTIGISLSSWTLANGSHPVIYCTVDNAQEWKDQKDDGKGIISATVNLVSKTLLSPFLHPSKPKKEEMLPKEEQYFQDAAQVTTLFGNGVVKGFRDTDGFYLVSLSSWSLSDGSHPVAYLRKDEIKIRVASGCQEGYPVYIKVGLTGVTGNLASVQATTGIHVVTCPSAGMLCYLQPENVVCPLKAAVGDDVLTAYGDGIVERYRAEDDTYQINLKEWRGAKLYAKAETFDRAMDGLPDHKGRFGMKWLLDMFFSSSDSKGETTTRSRSNSITSGRSRATS